jgi:hypothetical protein
MKGGYVGTYNLYIDQQVIPKIFALITDRVISGPLFGQFVKFQEFQKNQRNLDVTINPPAPTKLPRIEIDLSKKTTFTVSSTKSYDFKANLIEIKITLVSNASMPEFISYYSSKEIPATQLNFNYFKIDLNEGTNIVTFLCGNDTEELKDLLLTFNQA